MSADPISDRGTADGQQLTAEDFEEALGELLRTANRHDVDLDRPWDFRFEDDQPDWMVEVTQLRKPACDD